MREQNVLMVEDNPADVFLITEAIRGHEVDAELTVVSDGESAINYIHTQPDPPNVIILDLNLPKHSGIQILEAIRSLPGYRQVPVIVFSSSVSENEYMRMGSLGVTAYMAKSLDLDEFNRIGSVIKDILSQSPIH